MPSNQRKKEQLYELITGDIDNQQKQKLKKEIDKLFLSHSDQSDLKVYSDHILSEDIINIYEGLYRIRKLLSAPDSGSLQSIMKKILKLPCINKICEIALSSDVNLLVYEALWIITNIGSGNENLCNEIIKRKGIEIMMKSIQSNFDLIVDQAVWSLANFSCETRFRDIIVQQNAIPQLLCIAGKYRIRNQDIYKAVVWCLSNIVRAAPCLTDTKNNKLTEFFSNAVNEFDDDEYLIDSLEALSYTARENYQIDSIFERNVVPKLVKLLQQQNINIISPTLIIISNLLSGDDNQTSIILKFNILKIFETLLDNKKTIIKNVCLAISNVAAGTSVQVKEILRNNSLMSKLLSLINQQNMDFNKEINWIFSNSLLNGSLEDVDYAIDLGLLQGIKKLLGQVSIKEHLRVTLKGIEGLLRRIQSDTKLINKIINDQTLEEIIEQLQYHRDPYIYNAALKILVNYRDLRKKID